VGREQKEQKEMRRGRDLRVYSMGRKRTRGETSSSITYERKVQHMGRSMERGERVQCTNNTHALWRPYVSTMEALRRIRSAQRT